MLKASAAVIAVRHITQNSPIRQGSFRQLMLLILANRRFGGTLSGVRQPYDRASVHVRYECRRMLLTSVSVQPQRWAIL